MSNIIQFTGDSRLDIEADKVIESSLGQGINQVLIIGYTDNGEDYTASSTSDVKELLFMIEKFKFELMTGQFNEE